MLRTEIPRTIATKFCGDKWKYKGFPCVSFDTSPLSQVHCFRLAHCINSDFAFPPCIIALIFEFTGQWRSLRVELPDTSSFEAMSDGIRTLVFDESGIYNFKLETCDRVINALSLSDMFICGEIVLSPGNGNRLYGSQDDGCCVLNIKGLRTHDFMKGDNGCRTCYKCVSGLLTGEFSNGPFSVNAVKCINGINLDRSGKWTNQINIHNGDQELRCFIFGNDYDDKRTKSYKLKAAAYGEAIQKRWFFWNVNMAPTDLNYLEQVGGIPLPYQNAIQDDINVENFFGM